MHGVSESGSLKLSDQNRPVRKVGDAAWQVPVSSCIAEKSSDSRHHLAEVDVVAEANERVVWDANIK
jgi:hypothetical protein